jgi:hypothetical protein
MRDTIDMAREAGGRAQQNKNCDVEYVMSADALKAFAELVRADEREACADVVESTPWSDWFRTDCAAAIRARGNT